MIKSAAMPHLAPSNRQVPILAGVLGVCVAASVAVAADRGGYFAAGLAGLSALALGLANWRWSVYALLLFIPVSGIPIILTYPHTQLAVLLKDLIFVMPAYAGFLLRRRRQGWSFPGAPLAAVGGFGALVLVQCIPQISNPLVALIGAKVWLLYVPMLFLGYHLVENRSQLTRLLGAMSLAGCLPLAIGIIEAILFAAGRSDLVYPWYGAAAQAVTQDFADVGSGLGVQLSRVPSTFSFVAQYFDFASVMVVITFAWWRLTSNRWGALLMCLATVGSLTSGARAAVIMTPLLIGLMVVLSGSYMESLATTLALGGGGAAAMTILGLNANVAVSNSVDLGTGEVGQGFVSGIPTALGLTLGGFGTGVATGASRYALGGSATAYAYSFSESWWVKAILELGVAGLVMLLLLVGVLVFRAVRSHLTLVDKRMRAVSAGLLALVVWTLIYAIKGVEIDIDPINVYFWLFAGMLFRLPAMDAGQQAGGRPAAMAVRLSRSSHC